MKNKTNNVIPIKRVEKPRVEFPILDENTCCEDDDLEGTLSPSKEIWEAERSKPRRGRGKLRIVQTGFHL